VAGTQTTLSGYAKEFFIDTGFKLDVGGVDIYDWKESGWALAIVLFYNAVFLMSFFYFTYTLTLNQVSFKYLSLLGNDTTR
jgi:hypothetical protein